MATLKSVRNIIYFNNHDFEALGELPFRNGNEPLPFHAAFFPTGGFIPAFARCCFCIAANLLVFTSPIMCASLIFPTSEKGTTSA